jgi:hypothetical protein
MGRRVTLPEPLRRTLRDTFGEIVDEVEIIERSWFAWAHVRAIATTRRRRIYLRHDANRFFADPELVLHEYFHVVRQWETRDLSVWRYVREWLRHGYFRNRYEVEARSFASVQRGRFCQLLANYESGREDAARPV